MKKYFFLILLTACFIGYFPSNAQTLVTNDLTNASWISDVKSLPKADSLFYMDDPAPLFRKTFAVNGEIKSATLFITSAGYYNASINAVHLDQNYCDPAWTNFRKRIYYTQYDIKGNLQAGDNCIGVTLGNGFYNPLPLKFWGHLNLRDYLPTGRPVFIAKLKIEYVNGKIEEIVTDHTWKYSDGPVIRNNVYLGEVYDARKEIKGWDEAKFDDNGWNSSIVKNGPGGKLQKTFFPHIQVIDVKKPVKITSVTNEKYLADMGLNFTGTFKIRLRGQYGDTIQFRFGERIYPDNELNPMTAVAGQIKAKGRGGSGAPDVAWQNGIYVFGEETEVWYEPVLSFRVFRYMEISGLKNAPVIDDIQGIALSTNVDRKNMFLCSSNLVNSIQDATSRTFLSNLMSVQSDCPGREKFGYGGDLYATDEAFIMNFNMQSFYRKVLYDWVDAVRDSVFIDGAPYMGLQYCGLNFEASILELQNNLYQYYGDTAIIHELYDFDLKWMEKAARIHPSGIVNKGIGDHESLVNVPVQLIGTAAYLNSARIMTKIAAIMGDKKNAEHFIQLEAKIKKNLLGMYWGNSSNDLINQQSREASMLYINTLPEKGKAEAIEKLNQSKELFNKQSLYAVLLYFDVVPAKDKKVAVNLLLESLDNAPSGHFTTGIFGTKYILEALSQNGYAERVFDIVNSTSFPGWGFMMDHGATTLWETWKESDDIYSNCHPMFGSVSGWFYRWIGGIRPSFETPGFKKFIIAPAIPKGLLFSSCSYESPLGTITSNWEKTENGYSFQVTVPKDGLAKFELPFKNPLKILVRNSVENVSFSPLVKADGTCSFELNTGQYVIVADKF